MADRSVPAMDKALEPFGRARNTRGDWLRAGREMLVGAGVTVCSVTSCIFPMITIAKPTE